MILPEIVPEALAVDLCAEGAPQIEHHVSVRLPRDREVLPRKAKGCRIRQSEIDRHAGAGLAFARQTSD